MSEKSKTENSTKASKNQHGVLDMEDATEVMERIRKPEDLLSGEWLRNLSDQELVLTVMSLVLELQSRVGTPVQGDIPRPDTDALAVSPHPFATDKDQLRVATDQFTRLPDDRGKGDKDDSKDTIWRFILISSNPKHKLLGLEIHDEVVVGRGAEKNGTPDLDLTSFDATPLGVSRRHAAFRPTPEGLMLVDLESTNGTYRNQTKLEPGKPRELHDEDTISFSELHFKLLFVKRPRKAAS